MRRVAVGIINRRNSENEVEYLLVKSHSDFGKYTGYWYPPGGHIDDGETEISALAREIKEELEIDAEPIKRIAKTGGDLSDQITYWWECESDNCDFKVNKEEIAEAGFFTKDQMERMDIFPATRKFFEKYVFNRKG